MRLDNFSKLNRLKLLYEEDTGQPLESSRYPNVKRHSIAECSPMVDIEEEIQALKEMAFEYPPGQDPPTEEETLKALRRSQAAFKRLLKRMQLNPISGLNGAAEYFKISEEAHKSAAKKEKFGKPGPTDYIVVAGDVDDMKFLNNKTGLGHAGVNSVLQTIGKLFSENFKMEGTECYHPCGDEFAIVSKIGGDQEMARKRFAQILKGCLNVSNSLAETGFHHKGWPDDRRVQPTISFAISNTDTSSKGLLTHVKTGKSFKFVVVVDRDLRYDLGFSPEELNKYVQSVKSDDVEVVVRDMPEMAVYESKMPWEERLGNQGPVVLECCYSEIPGAISGELEQQGKMKTDYLNAGKHGGAHSFGGKLYPLKESFMPSG